MPISASDTCGALGGATNGLSCSTVLGIKAGPSESSALDTEHQDVAGQLENQQMAVVEASTDPLQLCVPHTEGMHQCKAGLRLPSSLSD